MILLKFHARVVHQLQQVFHDVDLVLEVIVGLIKVLELKKLRLLIQFLLAQQHVIDHLIDVLLLDQQLFGALSKRLDRLRALRKKIKAIVVLAQPLHAIGLHQRLAFVELLFHSLARFDSLFGSLLQHFLACRPCGIVCPCRVLGNEISVEKFFVKVLAAVLPFDLLEFVLLHL